MPLESITCTSCGAGDVQEVKPGTYFCNHCEGVFKHVDPSKVTVESRPAFCSCGNRVEYQCQVCKETGLCWKCDVVLNTTFRPWELKSVSVVDHHNLWAKTIGYGYQLSRYGYQVSEDALFLPLEKLVHTLCQEHAGLVHACKQCACAACVKVADQMAADKICFSPYCTNFPERCPCCNEAYCNKELK